MESGVRRVWLQVDVTLDIEALTEYSGQGKCKVVGIFCDTMHDRDSWREKLKTWATKLENWKINWKVDVKQLSDGRGFYLLSDFEGIESLCQCELCQI